MTANDIITSAFKLFDEETGCKYEESGNRTFALEMLNDGYFEICHETQCVQNVATLTTIPGTREYSLPDGFISMLEVESIANYRFLSPIFFKNIDVAIQGYPKAYYLTGSTMGFDVMPDNVYTMVQHYYYAPTLDDELTLSDEPTLIPAVWQRTLKYYVVMKLFEIDKEADPSRISIWENLYNQKLQKMKEKASIKLPRLL